MKLQKIKGVYVPFSEEDQQESDKVQDNEVIDADTKRLDKRTLKQNAAFWKWAEMLATFLNESGFYVSNIIKLETMWNKDRIKALIFNAVIENMGKRSSTQLTKKEIDELIDAVTKAFATKGITIPMFPNIER